MNKIDLIIDALELARNEIHDPTLWTDKVDKALAAARELQAEKQEPVAWMNKHGLITRALYTPDESWTPLYTAPLQTEKQEPVAYRKEAHGMWFYIEKKPSPPNDDYAPLYTAPPRKEWVGLTDDKMHKIIDNCTPDDAAQEELNDFARAVRFAEAELKEKNT